MFVKLSGVVVRHDDNAVEAAVAERVLGDHGGGVVRRWWMQVCVVGEEDCSEQQL